MQMVKKCNVNARIKHCIFFTLYMATEGMSVAEAKAKAERMSFYHIPIYLNKSCKNKLLDH